VSKLTGVRRMSFASAEETAALTGQMIGGVTVFGLPEGVPLYVDAEVMKREYIVVGGGNRSTKIKLAPELLRKMPRMIVSDIAVPRTA
jgi:prolyl-tRNA editing enzyme YbaK/EbsC (Cys-tRNA(Pro) deacylase)